MSSSAGSAAADATSAGSIVTARTILAKLVRMLRNAKDGSDVAYTPHHPALALRHIYVHHLPDW